MATKDQFDAFKFLFQWEDDRAKSLGESAKNYVALITLAFGYLGFKLSDADFAKLLAVHLRGYPLGLILYGLMTALLLLSLVLTLVSLFIRRYERITDPNAFFVASVSRGDTVESFFDSMIVDMNVATERNSAVNNSRAYSLIAAALFLLGAIVIYGAIFCLYAWCKAYTGSCT
jgi:hypothetical protein